jgi:hypothetical protein
MVPKGKALADILLVLFLNHIKEKSDGYYI